jgi:membrane protein
MLLGAGLLLSTYIGSLRWFNHINLLEIAHIGLFLPFICTLLAFGFLYLAVPHCTVKFRHAMAGSVIASIMFELSKHIFGLYVHYFPTYALLYGALAAIPLFLLWLYLAWAIFLFGAEVVSGLRLRQAQRSVEQTYPFILGYRLLGHLWAMQGRGKGLSLPKLLDLEPHCPVDTMKAVLVRLQASRFIYSLDEDCYLLSADLHKLSLLDFYTRMEWYLPSTIAHADDAWQQALAERLAVFAKHCQQDLNVPLAQLFDKH